MKRKKKFNAARLIVPMVLALSLAAVVVADGAQLPPSVFSIVHDVWHAPRIVNHGIAYRTYTPVLLNFIAPGSVVTVADALKSVNIPLTARQARIVPLCKKLNEVDAPIMVQADPYQYGVASWYGPGFHGQVAASGETYNMYDLTAAHRTLPLRSVVRVVSQRTGRSVVVRINDRGPYADGRIIDLSYRAKEAMGMDDLSAVYLERIDTTALDSCK